jgi:hypothetical protein
MRLLRRTLFVVVVLAVIAGGVVYFTFDRILRRAIETEGTASLRLTTTLNSARLSLFGGKLALNNLRIASPQGFPAPHMLETKDIDLLVKYSELRKEPIHVESLIIDHPRLVIEQSGGALNFKRAADRMPPSGKSSDRPVKLIIDDLQMKDAQVVIHPGLPGVRNEIVVQVPSLVVKDVGRGRGAQNGAAIKDVAMVVITALASKAAESGSLPPELKAILHLNAGQVAGLLGDPKAVGKEAGKLLKDELGGILGGKSSDAAPAGRSGTPSKR